MDPVTHQRTKAMLMKEYKASGKDLGTFAADYMDIYDDLCYEVCLTNATSKGKKVTGTAILGSCAGVEKFIENYEISGAYTINLIDTQVEFFNILREIKKDIEDERDPNACYSSALKELLWGE